MLFSQSSYLRLTVPCGFVFLDWCDCFMPIQCKNCGNNSYFFLHTPHTSSVDCQRWNNSSCCFLGPGSFLEMDLPERRLVSRMFCTVIFLKKTFLVLVTQELLLSSNYKYSSGLYFFLPPSLLIIPFESVVIIPERQHILISADMFFIGNQRQSIKSKITAFQARWKHLKILVTSPFQFVDIFLLWSKLNTLFQVSSGTLLLIFCFCFFLGTIWDTILNSSRQK